MKKLLCYCVFLCAIYIIWQRRRVVTLPDGTDTIAVRHIGYLGLTWAHRAFDGSIATQFLNRIQTNLETWDWDQELR